jgi:HAD superfamily hydrolase (TIGR01490 family)
MIRSTLTLSPPMPTKIAAFFDLDCTLVACNTGRLFLRDLRRRGEISLAKALRAISWLVKYRLAIVDLPTITAHVADFLRGKSEEDFAEQCQRLVEDEVLPRLLPAGLRAVERHRADGHVLALLSSSPSYIVGPVARALSVEAVGATEFEVERGKLTGQLRGPACFGSGKIHWAESLGASHSIDVGASWFYTDSFTDLPMLERVTHRVAVNPDPRLKKTARSRGWPVEDWMSSLVPKAAVL